MFFIGYTGLPSGPTLVINLEYGHGFSGAGYVPYIEFTAAW